MVDSSTAKGTLEGVEVARRQLGRLAKPLEQAGVLGVFSLTLLLFFLLFCCAYLDYWSFAPGGKNGVKGWGLKMGIGIESGERDGDGDGCDLIDGDWVWDESYPLYDAKDCGFLDEGFRCAENGRPDRFYSKWRWQPKHCDLPRFDAKMMLETFRKERLAFVGHFIGRSQWESFLCMLSSAITDKSSI